MFILKTSWFAGKIHEALYEHEFQNDKNTVCVFTKKNIKQMLRAAYRELKKCKGLDILHVVSIKSEVKITI